MTPFCCDRHNDNSFKLESLLPGYLYTGAITIIQVEPRTQASYRPTWERHALDLALISWVKEQVAHDRLCRPAHFILSKARREVLVKTKFEKIVSPSAIAQILQETAEWERAWAGKIYNLLREFQNNRPPKPVKKT